MVKKISITIIAIIFCNLILAQCPNRIIGIYKTQADFANSILSYQSNCNANKDTSIYLNDLFKSKMITIRANGNKQKIAKNSIYGFIKGDKSLYRLQGNEAYKFLDTSTSIKIYHMNLPQRQTGKINVTRYLYSNGYSGVIKKLSINNLLVDYATNLAFCEALKTRFKYNTELIEMDETTKSFKILVLINQYIK